MSESIVPVASSSTSIRLTGSPPLAQCFRFSKVATMGTGEMGSSIYLVVVVYATNRQSAGHLCRLETRAATYFDARPVSALVRLGPFDGIH